MTAQNKRIGVNDMVIDGKAEMAKISDIYDAMFEETCRLEEAWPFPVLPVPDSMKEAIADAIENQPAWLMSLLQGWSESEIDELYDHNNEAFEELCASAFRKHVFGWVGIAATPVMRRVGENSSAFSWGHYHTELLFAPSGEDLMRATVEWAAAWHTRDTAKSTQPKEQP